MKVFVFLILVMSYSITIAQNNNLPPNPEAGKCYVKCYKKNKKKTKWKEISCALINFQELDVRLENSNEKLTDKDRKIIDKELVPFIAKDYKLHIQSHYVAKDSEVNNIKKATERGVLLGNYLIEKGMNPELLIVTSYGDVKSDKTSIKYRIINVSEETE